MLAAVLVAAPIFVPDATLVASRLAGPLAITAFVLIELAVALRLLFWFLQTIFSVILAFPSLLLIPFKVGDVRPCVAHVARLQGQMFPDVLARGGLLK